MSTTMGVSGSVEYDLSVMCFNDDHDAGIRLIYAEEQSDKGNDILECPECGARRAVDVHVAPVI